MTLPRALDRWLPSWLALSVVAVTQLASRNQTGPAWAGLMAALLLVTWNAMLVLGSSRTPARRLQLTVDLRKQHYLQACAQGTVLLYWGWYWAPVRDMAPLILTQLLFAYAFDMLLGWTRRGTYTLGFGPFPVIFSINLFLWFRQEWFAFQLLMVAVGFAAKDLIRWTRDGRQAHIFNPSSFPLAIASVILIATGSSDLTRGQDIAVSQFYPPQMYLLLFLVAVPGQFLFGVASMTLSAVFTTYLFGLLYLAVTGTYFFLDSYVPIAVFLGMHLLFTDPSTSPRTELGRLAFGALYGLSAVALYQVFIDAGIPAFYDKLLQVPLLNLSVRAIDRGARSPRLSAIDPGRLWRTLAPRQRHLAYLGLWAVVFSGMSLAGGVGDHHPGQWLPFWNGACQAGSTRACDYASRLERILCDAGSGWACNASALRTIRDRDGQSGGRHEIDPDGTQVLASGRFLFDRSCRLGFVRACRNAVRLTESSPAFEDGAPALSDYVVLTRGSKGPVTTREASALYARACAQGWPEACKANAR